MKNYKILIIGLGSIGKNLALSLVDKGYKINVWDKNRDKNMTICKYSFESLYLSWLITNLLTKKPFHPTTGN